MANGVLQADSEWAISVNVAFRVPWGSSRIVAKLHKLGLEVAKATVMISQLPTDQWYGGNDDNTLADAILDQ